jgi:hypothetical protein
MRHERHATAGWAEDGDSGVVIEGSAALDCATKGCGSMSRHLTRRQVGALSYPRAIFEQSFSAQAAENKTPGSLHFPVWFKSSFAPD